MIDALTIDHRLQGRVHASHHQRRPPSYSNGHMPGEPTFCHPKGKWSANGSRLGFAGSVKWIKESPNPSIYALRILSNVAFDVRGGRRRVAQFSMYTNA